MQKLKALLCLELVGEREISLYSKSIRVCASACSSESERESKRKEENVLLWVKVFVCERDERM